jgi:hypothetical protein
MHQSSQAYRRVSAAQPSWGHTPQARPGAPAAAAHVAFVQAAAPKDTAIVPVANGAIAQAVLPQEPLAAGGGQGQALERAPSGGLEALPRARAVAGGVGGGGAA